MGLLQRRINFEGFAVALDGERDLLEFELSSSFVSIF